MIDIRDILTPIDIKNRLETQLELQNQHLSNLEDEDEDDENLMGSSSKKEDESMNDEDNKENATIEVMMEKVFFNRDI